MWEQQCVLCIWGRGRTGQAEILLRPTGDLGDIHVFAAALHPAGLDQAVRPPGVLSPANRPAPRHAALQSQCMAKKRIAEGEKGNNFEFHNYSNIEGFLKVYTN